MQANLRGDKDNPILVYGNGCLHAVSSIDGEVVWNKELTVEGFGKFRSSCVFLLFCLSKVYH